MFCWIRNRVRTGDKIEIRVLDDDSRFGFTPNTASSIQINLGNRTFSAALNASCLCEKFIRFPSRSLHRVCN